ncbi:hypothetical protein PAXINDRAFT_21801 [Paxillus involutus ATCC 200175]|uniref:Uncharacterized protein n=1 Tax=Paxillus involutus ATCC 200175 TaxID=664439 RepID=A0A0C9SLS1_PAXIN|nr:hypothetical protein PAXINDRAFT_21801 [Paxillus involutus ATCC 200175]
MTRQTAYNEATDPSNPNTRGTGMTKPAGRSYKPPNELNEGEKGGEEDDMGEWASGIETPSSNDDGGDEDVHHAWTKTTPEHAARGGGEVRSVIERPGPRNGHAPQNPTTRVISHAATTDAVRRDVEWRGLRRGEPPPVPTPSPPPVPTPAPSPPLSPTHPERQHDNNNTKSSRTATRTRADTVHNPGGETKKTPSVRLEGERRRRASPYIELIDVDETNAEEDGRPQGQSKAKKSPRDPVGTMDSDEHHPNKPTEPPDEEEGEQRGNKDEGVERDEPGDKGNEDESRGVEGEAKGQSEDGQQQNGRPSTSTDSLGPPTPSTKCPKRPTHHANPPSHGGC